MPVAHDSLRQGPWLAATERGRCVPFAGVVLAVVSANEKLRGQGLAGPGLQRVYLAAVDVTIDVDVACSVCGREG